MDTLLAPQVASPSMFRQEWVWVSDVRGGVECGGMYHLTKICPSGSNLTAIGGVTPNIIFSNCRLRDKIHLASHPDWKLKRFKKEESSLAGVYITPGRLTHIRTKHSLDQKNNHQFLLSRESALFKDPNNSTFIHREIIVPVINATLVHPDKIIPTLKQNRYYLEKMFCTEIGHTWEGCAYVVRLVIESRSPGGNQLITAHPIPHFSPDWHVPIQ